MSKEKLCIYGAGAIGLDLAVHAILADIEVTLIARGQTYEVLASRGIEQLVPERRFLPDRFRVVRSAAEAGPLSLVFVTTKVEDLLDVSSELKSSLSKDSLVISGTNGIPPWFSYLQDETVGRFHFSREPRQRFLENIPPGQLLGCIIKRSAQSNSPGVLQQSAGEGFTIGELDHSLSERANAVQTMLTHAGFAVDVSRDIHRDIWLKLIGNISMNPLSVLTEQSVGEMIQSPSVRERIRVLAREAELVGIRLGVIREGDFDFEMFFQFLSLQLSAHKPSMLQDFEKGKRLEVHRILEVVEMLASASGPVPSVPVPGLLELHRELMQKIAKTERG